MTGGGGLGISLIEVLEHIKPGIYGSSVTYAEIHNLSVCLKLTVHGPLGSVFIMKSHSLSF